ASRPELRVEPPDRVQTGLPERHVAARDMLRLAIGDENVHGPTRRLGHALGDRSVSWRGDVRTPHAGVRGAHEGGDEIGEPLGVGVRVVVEVGDDLPGGRLQPRVAGVGKTAVLRLDEPAIVPPRDGGRVVGGPVVHDNDFIVGVLEPSEPLEAVADGGRSEETRLNSSHGSISYAVFCLKEKKQNPILTPARNAGSRRNASTSIARPTQRRTSRPLARKEDRSGRRSGSRRGSGPDQTSAYG